MTEYNKTIINLIHWVVAFSARGIDLELRLEARSNFVFSPCLCRFGGEDGDSKLFSPASAISRSQKNQTYYDKNYFKEPV